jgi:hypothetical protein
VTRTSNSERFGNGEAGQAATIWHRRFGVRLPTPAISAPRALPKFDLRRTPRSHDRVRESAGFLRLMNALKLRPLIQMLIVSEE